MATDDLLAPSPALSAPSTPQPRDGQTFDNTGYCVLSLDGGGVRGLSTLYILDSIINGINNERREAGLLPRKPCEIFDLIGGTSTGGLIAIMLGHLEMTVGECIEAYIKLMQQVFEKKVNRSFKGVGLFGTVQARFSSKALADAISQVIKSRGISLDEKFENGNKPRCRVFVCTKYQKTNVVTRLRNYRVRTSSDRGPTILEAALATTAAPTYFEGVAIEGSTYVDGALGANNPTIQVEEEATDLWSESDGQIQPLIKCFISIGTGEPGLGSVSDKGFRKLIETLKKEATETEKTTEQWLGRWRQHVERNRCFRFNVIHGLENVRLEEYKERDVIQSTTDTYLQSRGTQTNVRKCVENLRMKEYEPTAGFMRRLMEQATGNASQRPSQSQGRATPQEILELIQNGKELLKKSSDQVTRKELLQARHYLSKALYHMKNEPNTSVKQFARVCQQLMEAEMKLSRTTSNPVERQAHVDQAHNYGQAALDNAYNCQDEFMVAQFDFLLATATAWRIYVEARLKGMTPRDHEGSWGIYALLDEKLGELKKFQHPNIRHFEAQAKKYQGYVTKTI